MGDEKKICQLIVRQRPASGDELNSLLAILNTNFGLESYTARQRLTGQGLAMFGKGPADKCRKIADILQKHKFACWVISPQTSYPLPDRLRSLEIKNEYVDFQCSHSTVRLFKGDRAVALMADISGELGGKLVKRMMSQKTYRGHVPAEVIDEQNILKFLYQGKPVFDFYIFTANGETAGVRVFPGKFNHTGLGERAGISAIGNLDTIRQLVEEYAGEYVLHTDFGLGHMPDCQLASATETIRHTRSGASVYGGVSSSVEIESRHNQGVLSDNLKSLSRYGSIVLQLQGSGLPETKQAFDEAVLAAGVTATAVVGQPAMGAIFGGRAADIGVPGLTGVAQEMQQAINENTEKEDVPAELTAGQKDLPAPPEKPEKKRTLSTTAKAIGGLIAGVTVTAGSGGVELLRLLASYGMSAGIVPGIAAVALLSGGFYFIFLKRQIENTPTSKIRSIAMGMVEVHGQTRRLYALVAPISHAACAWYRIKKYRKDSKDNWKLVREEDSGHVPFQVDDGTGRVIVDPVGASVKAKIRHTSYPGKSGAAFMSSFGENEKLVEEIIYEGTSVYVLGYAQPLREEKLTLRERTLAKLRQLKLDPQAMHRYDSNGDGQIDAEEWEAARGDAEQLALREHLDEQGDRKRQEEHVVIANPPQKRLPFVIAEAESEAHLTTKYGWLSIPLLLAGAVSLVFALYKFLEFMNL